MRVRMYMQSRKINNLMEQGGVWDEELGFVQHSARHEMQSSEQCTSTQVNPCANGGGSAVGDHTHQPIRWEGWVNNKKLLTHS